MASIASVCSAVADTVTAYLVPYQPSTPDVPNADPLAGQIPRTQVGDGHPMQFQGTLKLEQGGAIIGVWDSKPEKIHPFIDRQIILGLDGNYYREVGRSIKEIVVEVWAYTYPARGFLLDLVRQTFGDALSIEMYDGTVARLIYEMTYNEDFMQMDSVWVSQIRYHTDITVTQLIGPSGGGAYPVTETNLYITTEDVAGTVIPPVEEVIFP